MLLALLTLMILASGDSFGASIWPFPKDHGPFGLPLDESKSWVESHNLSEA
jgi:hypothetical protein